MMIFKKQKHFGFIAVLALILFSTVLISCGNRLSGTFVYENAPTLYSLTFSGNNFSGVYGGEAVTGTFTVADNRLILTVTGGGSFAWRVVDNRTLIDDEGDVWTKR